MLYIWDEGKREANLIKHGFDFADAHLVYENPAKITLESPRRGETRNMDIAFVEIAGSVLALVYTGRGNDIRVISLRRASRGERRRYAAAKEQD